MSAEPGFFVGWAGSVPVQQRRFLRWTIAGALGLFAALGLGLSAAIDDPGGGAADWGQEVQREGVLRNAPYPLLHLADGHTLMMAGFGKSGVDADPALNGKQVRISGYMVKRGALDMLQTSPDAIEPRALPEMAAPTPIQLGRWRLTGEICDGKCYAGVMRPGSGLAHKACGSFCVLGGVPPVFITTSPVAGASHLLIAGSGDAPMPDRLRDLIGLRVTLEGSVERVGDLLIFHADPTTVKTR